MVKDYIATEVGDKIIAKLINPYLKVNRILDWNIKAGFSSEFTVGKLTFTEGTNACDLKTINIKKYIYSRINIFIDIKPFIL